MLSWVATIAPAGVSLLGGYSLAAIINRRAANKEAEAAARQARTADWEGFSGRLAGRLDRVEERLDVAEAQASKYRIAIVYIRQIAEWVAEKLPGYGMPAPPPELEPDL